MDTVSLAERSELGAEPTKERYAGRIGQMQCFPVITKVLGAVHQLPHLLQHSLRSRIDLCPSAG